MIKYPRIELRWRNKKYFVKSLDRGKIIIIFVARYFNSVIFIRHEREREINPFFLTNL